LPVDDYRAWLTSFSADTVLKGIDKVSIWGLSILAHHVEFSL
jgi:hypothetical protein